MPKKPPTIERRIITSEAEWLAWRKHDVTAGTVGALFGLHPYETIYGLHAKVRGVELPERAMSSVMARGIELQELVGRYVQRAHPDWKLRAANSYFRHTQLRLGGTPDFFCTEIRPTGRRRGIVEAKTVASAQFKRYWTDGAPAWISLQCLTCMMLARAEFGLIAALEIKPWGAPELHEFEVPRHEAAEARIRDGVQRFWHDVEAGNTPKADFTRDAALITAMHATATPGKTIDLRSDNRVHELLAEREKVKADCDTAEARCKEIDIEIKQKIGDAEIALVNGWRVTLKTVQKKEHFVRASTYRQLRAVKDDEGTAAA
jgi:predicted phage-related endonuclease